MNIMISIMIVLSFIFMWLNHPLSMAIVIIMQTLMVSMIIGMIMSSFLFSYILLIIMLSGMLVLFVYMASIASNEKFSTSIKLMLVSMMIFTSSMTLLNVESLNMKSMLHNNTLVMNLNKLFSTTTMVITMIMVLYLFFSMVVVSNIVNINEGPLRIKK